MSRKPNQGIDEFFMDAYQAYPSWHPGRMASRTATLFLLNGTAIFLAAEDSRSLVAIQVSGMLSAVGLAICKDAGSLRSPARDLVRIAFRNTERQQGDYRTTQPTY